MLIIRNAKVEDANSLLSIYAPYVENTAITFEYVVPSLEEFKSRIASTLKKYPYLVAELDGKVVGYAYASSFKDRAAYKYSVEISIYVEKTATHSGIGKRLHKELELRLKDMGILNMYSCIATPIIVDEYLDFNSVKFHEHMGYTLCGTFNKCGLKFGRWYNMVWMEKLIGNHL